MGELREICAMFPKQRLSKKPSHCKYLLALVIDSIEPIDSGSPKNHYFTSSSDQIFILGNKMSVENTK